MDYFVTTRIKVTDLKHLTLEQAKTHTTTSEFSQTQPKTSAMRRWAVVTGAGTGIGKAVAEALAQGGIHVLAVGRRRERLDEVAAAAPPGVVHPLEGDISKDEVMNDIFEAIPASDKLCYLVQNAAVGVPGRLADMRRDDFEYAMAVNVTAPLFLTQKLLPKLQVSNGRILHLGTGVAFNAQLGTTTYGLTKMAFHRLYEHLKVAKAEQLPHVAYFAQAEEAGLIRPAETAARFIMFLLQQTDDQEFSRQEWKLGDQAHWHRWNMTS